MTVTRRSVFGLFAGVAALNVGRARAADGVPEIAPGPFKGSRDSLRGYQVPEWFRDAKFGIWAHWGPQSAAEYGDWYARNMYIEGSRQYKYHFQRYGHPSKFGYKDLVPTWKAEKFDAEHLMDLYKKAGAKYFVSMGVHHDNFDLWKSKHHATWNSVATGPRKDIVGLFRQAALKRGLKFGVSEHLGPSYHWFGPAYGADKEGPYAGVPYDGRDPQYAELYHPLHEIPKRANGSDELDDPKTMPDSWKREYVLRIQDLIDNYEPDLLYTDGPIRYEEWGLATIAHLYNRSAQRHKGKVEAVYTSKGQKDCETGTCLLDLERGIMDRISENPWQTDTCIGSWHYDRPTFEERRYKSPKTVLDMLMDIVSRNGNLLLNFPLPSSGELDSEEMKILSEITKWMAVNGEGIYGTRPWKIFGEGPGTAASSTSARVGEGRRKPLTAEDVRFTTKGKTLYAFCMGWPEKQAVVGPLAANNKLGVGKIRNVTMLGFKGQLKWVQDESGLEVQMPPEKPCDHAFALRITGA